MGAFLELEQGNSDLKPHLREVYITAAKEVDVGSGKKAIVIFVPPPQLREFEKKFSGKHIVVIAQRRILPKETRKSTNKSKQKRPRSRTLTSVHEKILEDLVFPAEIIGKRTRVKLDASKFLKIHLDRASKNNVEHKTETFAAVY